MPSAKGNAGPFVQKPVVPRWRQWSIKEVWNACDSKAPCDRGVTRADCRLSQEKSGPYAAGCGDESFKVTALHQAIACKCPPQILGKGQQQGNLESPEVATQSCFCSQ